jgi:hypothetical protein
MIILVRGRLRFRGRTWAGLQGELLAGRVHESLADEDISADIKNSEETRTCIDSAYKALAAP